MRWAGEALWQNTATRADLILLSPRAKAEMIPVMFEPSPISDFLNFFSVLFSALAFRECVGIKDRGWMRPVFN